ncbi:hypothetical protein [Mesorhizobium sp.]|uniref:hypothetical protein n=1 Tax=Mesorhizobium sp. TaxID=1871066 RepID=UPI000FE72279|nr:hypothetical protein [Mesorhizobium sp.]RWA62483.1 MAG: hypothetical protein EOQ29_30145 [Mesorhizobium sp.]
MTTIKAGINWPGHYGQAQSSNQGNLTMTSDIIEIWAGMLGLAYLAAAGLYFEMISAGKRSRLSASYGFGRHPRLHPVKIRHSR